MCGSIASSGNYSNNLGWPRGHSCAACVENTKMHMLRFGPTTASQAEKHGGDRLTNYSPSQHLRNPGKYGSEKTLVSLLEHPPDEIDFNAYIKVQSGV